MNNNDQNNDSLSALSPSELMNRRDAVIRFLVAAAGSMAFPYASLAAEGQSAVAGASSSNEKSATSAADNAIKPAFSFLRFGDVMPAGWIKEQMLRDIQFGFAGRLDELCHQAATDIFATGRKTYASTHVTSEHGEAKLRPAWWWNGETEGNWRAGFIMLAYLSGDEASMRKADTFVQHVLSFQEDNGYLGACDKDVRYQYPGDMWTQACLLRGLLAYAELSNNDSVLAAVRRAADASITAYRGGNGKQTWKQSHDLMIIDVLERLFDLTGDAKYKDFAVWLYEDWSNAKDGMVGFDDDKLGNLLNRELPFVGHGAHVVEIVRVPLWLWMITGREDLRTATQNAFDKLERYKMPGGSVVGQENIRNLSPDPNKVEFEYCTSKEALTTYISALQKTGKVAHAERVERLFFNDAQGSRLPDGRAIRYLTSDNCSHCDGLTPDGSKHEKRNKFSPTHQDVAVCCNPNATNIASLYVRGMWMRHQDGGLVALLYGPCIVATTIGGVKVKLEEKTDYPFENTVKVAVEPERESSFSLYFRDPEWSHGTKLECKGAHIERNGDFWKVSKNWKSGDRISLSFFAKVQPVTAVNGEVALQYGALLFALPISSTRKVVRTYPVAGFEDTYYEPKDDIADGLALTTESHGNGFGFEPTEISVNHGKLRPFDTPTINLRGKMVSKTTGAKMSVELVPMGCAPTLRRLTFPVEKST